MRSWRNARRAGLSPAKWMNSLWARRVTALPELIGTGHCGSLTGPVAASSPAMATGSMLITPFTGSPPDWGNRLAATSPTEGKAGDIGTFSHVYWGWNWL